MTVNQNIVELKVFDFDVAHQEISTLLGLSPSIFWVKGEEYTFGGNYNHKKIRENSYWEYRSTEYGNGWIGTQVENFIEEIISPRVEVLKDMSSEYHMELSVVQYMYDGCNPGLYFKKKFLNILNESGLELNIDIYVLGQQGDKYLESNKVLP
ncbi:DUF4279 domain-containing protein [Rufibacter tibetensis]|uniref:DUF4279 domain-containing protein n=1 Tax=Rufibacter tibetensis TaxID=512763 RepID=A0A0N7HX08_9BACT|nr:DUF4279 domain-containing protein [Rufibacter tibetensis]ALJ00729.1 hypothetical protein DC20_19280 [Rufibacter tibetensis]